jgi:hypothetical protein
LAQGPPFIQVNGCTTVGDPITGPRDTYENAYDYSGSLSWIRSRHGLKFGGGYQHLNVNALQGIATNSFFVFDPGFPIAEDGFAAFLFGQPVFFLQRRGDFSRGIRDNGYAQDTYKVTSRLPKSTSGNADQRRLYSGCTLNDPPSSCIFSSTGLIAGIANSSYNALEASLRKRFSHGMAFLASYTFSKTI